MTRKNQNSQAPSGAATASQEFMAWREQYGKLSTEVEKEDFTQMVHAELAKKDEAYHLENIMILKAKVSEFRMKVEEKLKYL